jgi:hypothetical protein
LTDIAEQQNLNFNQLTLPNFRNGLTVFQIPPQRQAPNVSRWTKNKDYAKRNEHNKRHGH